MSDGGLRRALTGSLSPRAWYRLLNSKVFFWASEERLHRLLCARAYRDDAHDVLVIDTAKVMRAHADHVCLAPINTGATKPFARPRGRATFSSIERYPWDSWRRKRPLQDAVVEVAFESGIADITRFVHCVRRMKQKRNLSTLFSHAA